MAPSYNITVKNTFLDFQPVDLAHGEQCVRQTLSCPCLSFLAGEAGVKTDSSGSVKTDSSGSQLPDVASSVSTDSDIPPNKGGNRKAVEKLQGQAVSMGNRALRNALATQMRLNNQLMQASQSSSGKTTDIFTLVRTQIHQMNAVNLSTAIHRIARLGGPGDQNETAVLEDLLTVIEEQTWRQLQRHDESMPAGCATIVAWSCASLQVFRPKCFGALIQVVEPGLSSCKDFEVTNLLWACAQLVKHLPKASEDGPDSAQDGPKGFGRPLCALMDAVEVDFQGRLRDVTSQILVSALVSVAMLSAARNLSLTTLFGSMCDAVALKSSELSLKNKTQLGLAGRIMRKNHEQVVQAVHKSFLEKCPELAVHFRV